MSSCVTGAKDSTLPKLSKTERFSKISRNDGRRGTFAEDLARYISRGKRVIQEILFIRYVRRSGYWCPETNCILEHQNFSFGKIIAWAKCSISYDLASFFRGRRRAWNRRSGKIPKIYWHEAVRSALNLAFLKQISQNYFIINIINLNNSGNFAK